MIRHEAITLIHYIWEEGVREGGGESEPFPVYKYENTFLCMYSSLDLLFFIELWILHMNVAYKSSKQTTS